MPKLQQMHKMLTAAQSKSTLRIVHAKDCNMEYKKATGAQNVTGAWTATGTPGVTSTSSETGA